MKKLIAALAVLAVAAAAQAELLATWDMEGSGMTVSANTDAANADQVTFYDFERGGSMTNPNTASSGHAQTANWNGNNLETTIDIATGYEIAGATMAISGGINGTTTGPGKLQWYVGEDPRGSVWNNTTTRNGAPVDPSVIGTISAGQGVTLSLRSDGTRISGDGAPTGNVRLYGDLTMDGTIKQATSVPEPATMSLLGLGALAMVIRRKLRK